MNPVKQYDEKLKRLLKEIEDYDKLNFEEQERVNNMLIELNEDYINRYYPIEIDEYIYIDESKEEENKQ